MTVRVLIVDDNEALAENVADILENEGFEVTCCSSPKAALSRALCQTFDCLVLDVRLPGIDGVELGMKLRELFPTASIVLMTAYASDERLDLAREKGLGEVLAKPFAVDRLVGAVRQSLTPTPPPVS